MADEMNLQSFSAEALEGKEISQDECRMLIIDSDVGSDDAVAILMAAQARHLCRILAITSVFGNVSADQAAQNAEILLRVIGHPRIPIFMGASNPMVRGKCDHWEGHGENGLLKTASPIHPVICRAIEEVYIARMRWIVTIVIHYSSV